MKGFNRLSENKDATDTHYFLGGERALTAHTSGTYTISSKVAPVGKFPSLC